jgi:hypothetical protein
MNVSACRCGVCAGNQELQHTHDRWRALFATLNERQARLFAADKALELGPNGPALASRILGLSSRTIERGIHELKAGLPALPPERARRPGGGRPTVEEADPTLLDVLDALLQESTAGDPMALLRWTAKSLRTLATTLKQQGHPISHSTLRRLLVDLHYSLRGNVKSLEGKQSPQRDAQFRYLHEQAKEFVRAQLPVISVDTKKKEKVGEFKNAGRQWRRDSRKVNVHDFPSLAEGVAIPYGVFDTTHNEGLVNVGMSHDTAEFAVESIQRWWLVLGRAAYPKATKLLITADNGGSNGSRLRLWKVCLQRFANRQGLDVTVCHYPTGTSKWNAIEHRLFSFISINWRGEPLTSYQAVVQLISHTTTTTGLRVKAELDSRQFQEGIEVSDEELSQIDLEPHTFLPAWNYTILHAR